MQLEDQAVLKFFAGLLLFILMWFFMDSMSTKREDEEFKKRTALCINKCEKLNKEAHIEQRGRYRIIPSPYPRYICKCS